MKKGRNSSLLYEYLNGDFSFDDLFFLFFVGVIYDLLGLDFYFFGFDFLLFGFGPFLLLFMVFFKFLFCQYRFTKWTVLTPIEPGLYTRRMIIMPTIRLSNFIRIFKFVNAYGTCFNFRIGLFHIPVQFNRYISYKNN